MTRMKKRGQLPAGARPERRIGPELKCLREDELLAFVLGSGVRGSDVKAIAANLLRKFGDKLLDATQPELEKIKGIGPTKAMRLVASFELAKRLSAGLGNLAISGPEDVAKTCPDLFHARQEYLGFLALNALGNLIARNDLYKGSECMAVADPKQLFREALRQQAHSIIVFHNHPSGDPSPSKEDLALARRLASVGHELNLPLVDFVIVGSKGWSSILGGRPDGSKIGYAREGIEQLTLSALLVEQPRNWPPVLPIRTAKATRPVRWAIDLFAGCGGLSLGLEQAGFEPLLVSELNRDAMDTYLWNRQHYHQAITSYHDVYSITDDALNTLREGWSRMGVGDIDLIAGGPPCQGYSGIGHRRSYKVEKGKIPSNYLFKEMTRIISRLRPRMFLFENVKGLLSARWTATGEKGEIWQAVQKAFRGINGGEYFVDFKLVQAKEYGVPQNRPRVLMVGIRKDLGWRPTPSLPASGLLPEPSGMPPGIEDILSDLVDGRYLGKRTTDRYPSEPRTDTQRMLRTSRDGSHVALKGETLTEQEYSDHAPRIREKFQHMLEHDGEIPEHMRTKKFAQRVLPRKWDERGPTITVTSLPEDYVHYCQPRALTVREWARLQMFPDWYQFKGPRTTGGLRRAGNPHQGIWDREVPKYTQIGNAVPVELARRVGMHLAGILKALGA